MNAVKKITVGGVLQEGFGLGLKNAPSLVGAAFLWLVTIWIPYLNVGTTIAMLTIPIELSKGTIVSPTFIFDSKYRRYMGEFFSLCGLMYIGILPALFFFIIPGYVVAIAWSMSIFLLLDKALSPSEAMIQSNKITYGYKWTIFLVNFVLGGGVYIAALILGFILGIIPFIGGFLAVIVIFALSVCYFAISLACTSIMYRKLSSEAPANESGNLLQENPIA